MSYLSNRWENGKHCKVDRMSDVAYRSVREWIKSKYHPGIQACALDIHEWFEGRYQIEEFVGAGHTSVVFRAIDTRLDRTTALKLWQTRDLDLHSAVLLKEAKYLAKIEHPRIVRVFDFGTEAVSSLPWMSLEFLGSRTLRSLINESGGLGGDWLSVIEFGRQVCSIVDYIHNSAGLFQLDLKPDNFAVSSDNTLKLMDLGSASDDRDRLDRFGTPGYVAPELLESAHVDSKCDIFAVGVLLYELLTGHNPLMSPQQRFIPYRGVKMSGAPKPLLELLKRMCSADPNGRPSADESHVALSSMADPKKKRLFPSIFISHSHLDKERFVRAFAQSMRRRGFKIWFDEKSLKVGEPFWDKIGNAIESCNFVVVVLSQNSLKSQGVMEELRTAQIFNLDNLKILPIRIDPISYSTIPVQLRSRHILDFVGWEDKKVFSSLIAKLASDIEAFWSARNASV